MQVHDLRKVFPVTFFFGCTCIPFWLPLELGIWTHNHNFWWPLELGLVFGKAAPKEGGWAALKVRYPQ